MHTQKCITKMKPKTKLFYLILCLKIIFHCIGEQINSSNSSTTEISDKRRALDDKLLKQQQMNHIWYGSQILKSIWAQKYTPLFPKKTELNLQKACILGTQEKPLNTEQGVFGNLRILMVHQFHHPFLGLEVCHNDPPSRMMLDELWEIVASNSQSPWIIWCIQNCNEDPQNL